LSDSTLDEIYKYLELDIALDQRLKLKSNLMKRVIYLTSLWHEGRLDEWIDKLANRCNISTRKCREDYLQPLITDGILKRQSDGCIQFVGLPENAVIPCGLLQEELDEENENRAKLGKSRVSLEEWRKMRKPRFKPVEG